MADITFDADCTAYLGTIISGQDYVYTMDSAGNTTVLYGYSNYDINAVALDPVTGDVVVAYSSTSAVGLVDTSSLSPIATGSWNIGTLWSSGYLNWCASSLAVDSSGCAWTPNFTGSGELDCVSLDDGSTTNLASFSNHLEGVALDSAEGLYVSDGAEIVSVDVDDGSTTTFYTAADDILDFVFDANDDLYIETDGGEILLLEAGESTASTFATVSGQGKLAIVPNGTLVRVIPDPVSPASYEEWALD